MSHTPGPWFVREVNDGIRPKVFVTREFGCEVPPKFYVAFLPEMDGGGSLADARLIAEAPAMLAALREALAPLESFDCEMENEEPMPIIVKIRSIIARIDTGRGDLK